MVAQRPFEGRRAFGEEADLGHRVGVLGRLIGCRKVGIDRTHAHLRAVLQAFAESWNLIGHEAEPVHAGIQLDVDGKIADPFFAEFVTERVQRVKVGDAGFQALRNHLVEEIRSGCQDQNGRRDAFAAQLDAFHGKRYGQIIHAGLLEHRAHFHRAVAVGVGLDQHEQFGGRLETRTEIPEIVQAVRQTQFQPCEIIVVVRHIVQIYDFIVTFADTNARML